MGLKFYFLVVVNNRKTKQKLDKIIVLKYIKVKSLRKITFTITLNTNGRNLFVLVIGSKLV